MTYSSASAFSPRKLLCFFTILMLTVALIGVLPVSGEEKIYDEVLRLHVIANSDSEEDQALKLKVRDAVLAKVAELLSGAESFDSALRIISSPDALDSISDAARRTVKKEGYDYPVNVTVGKEHYPRKSYESLSFPSGSYTSLRVQIGEHRGENWWCVLFPRLCLGAAAENRSNEESFIAAGFTPEQYRIVTDSDEPKYEIKFKILEVIRGMTGG